MKVYILEGEPKAIFAGIAAATRKQKSPAELVEYYEKHRDKAESLCEKLVELGHYSVFELEKAVVFEGISRLFSFVTWVVIRPNYGVALGGLEKSLRETEPTGFLINDKLTQEAFELYKTMVENKVPKEDARYILPASTLTWIAIKYDTRYLSKLCNFYRQFELEEFHTAANELEKLLIVDTKEKPLKSYDLDSKPEGEEFFTRNFFRCKIEGSMSMWHQLIRNRLLDVEVEGILHARKNPLVIPKTFEEHGLVENALELWEKAKESKNTYHFLIGQKLYGFVSGEIGALDLFCQYRCCLRAQWEIRKIAWKLKEEGAKYGLSLGPRCFKLGYCPENEKDCAFYHFFETYSKKVVRTQR